MASEVGSNGSEAFEQTIRCRIECQRIQLTPQIFSNIFGRHFQGAYPGSGNPGLKPWATIYSRFAAASHFSHAANDIASIPPFL